MLRFVDWMGGMNVKNVVIGISSLLLLVIGVFYYLQSGGEEIHQLIPFHVDPMSAKDLEAANPYVKEYVGNEKFDLGKVRLINEWFLPENSGVIV